MNDISHVPQRSTRLRSLVTKKRVIIAAVIALSVVGASYMIFSQVRQNTIRSITADADATAAQYTKSVETYVMTTLREAILESEGKDKAIVNTAESSRPAPPSSLDVVLTKEQRAAMNAPYPLTYAVSAEAVASLAPPKLKAVADGDLYSDKYRDAAALQQDVDAMYKKITNTYVTENCRIQVRNDIMAFNNEVTDLDEVSRFDNAIDVKVYYEAKKLIFQKYQTKIVNDSTKVCLNKRYYAIFEEQFKNAIAQQDIVITKITEGVRGEPLAAPIKNEGNSYKEIIAMRLSLDISRLGKFPPGGGEILYLFVEKHFNYLHPNPYSFIVR
ncbi:MAG: hypothetical protein WBB39_00860 [Candidatus Saccharimonadales bacterium]